MRSQYRAMHYSASRGKNVQKSLTTNIKLVLVVSVNHSYDDMSTVQLCCDAILKPAILKTNFHRNAAGT